MNYAKCLASLFGVITALSTSAAQATVYEYVRLDCRINNPVSQQTETAVIYSEVSTFSSRATKVTTSGQSLSEYSTSGHTFHQEASIDGRNERVRFVGKLGLFNGIVSNVKISSATRKVTFEVTGETAVTILGAYYSRVADPYEYLRAIPQAVKALDSLNVVRPNDGLVIPLGQANCSGENGIRADSKEQG